jgi:hypothetical protein
VAPWLAECPEGETVAERYRARRFRCVKDCDAALLFGDITSPGSQGLNRDCASQGKPCVHIQAGLSRPSHVIGFLREAPYIKRLMIAGDGESPDPGIGERVERFLIVVFKTRGIVARPTA